MIPLAVPTIGEPERANLNACIDEGFVSTVGRFVSEFESGLATACGARGAVATSAGTTALHVALVAVGVGRDDLVLAPSFTFIASANAISHAGATPWLIDVDPGLWTLDPGRLEAALKETRRDAEGRLRHEPTGRRVGAIMPVYTLGMPAEMDAITRIAVQFGLPVVADAAAAVGASYNGRPVGALGANLTCLSFNGNKTITTGGGGAIIGQDDNLIQRVRHLTTTARAGANYDHDAIGFNYRMTNVEAAIGVAQLGQLNSFLARKRAIDRAYRGAFAGYAALGEFPAREGTESACWFSGFYARDLDADAVARIRGRLREAGIDARPFWKPVHLQAPYADAPCEVQSVTEEIWQRIVTLPCSTGLPDQDLAFVIDATHAALSAEGVS